MKRLFNAQPETALPQFKKQLPLVVMVVVIVVVVVVVVVVVASGGVDGMIRNLDAVGGAKIHVITGVGGGGIDSRREGRDPCWSA